MDRPPSLPHRYRYEWALFTDWCAAIELRALPALPTTVARFLDENPAGVDAQRRRVAAINRAHHDAVKPAPGTVTAIRMQLEKSRVDRTARRRALSAPIIAALPVTGWPAGMFGRRDALILALHGAGLRPVDISALDRRDLSESGGTFRIGAVHQLQVMDTEDGAAPIGFTSVWRNWEQILRMIDRHPSTRILERCLRTGMFPAEAETFSASDYGPVIPPIDRWGAVPLPLVALSPGAVAQVLAAHLTGTAPQRRAVPTRARRGRPLDEQTSTEAAQSSEEVYATSLADTYAAGVAARLAAHRTLADVAELFDEVEDRADELLRRTLALIDGM